MPIWMVDVLRTVEVVLGVLFCGIFLKVTVLKWHDRSLAPITHPALIVGILVLALSTVVEHIARWGQPASWRLFAHSVAFGLGIWGLMHNNVIDVQRPWDFLRRGRGDRERGRDRGI